MLFPFFFFLDVRGWNEMERNFYGIVEKQRSFAISAGHIGEKVREYMLLTLAAFRVNLSL